MMLKNKYGLTLLLLLEERPGTLQYLSYTVRSAGLDLVGDDDSQ
jgi:hypothetical protein